MMRTTLRILVPLAATVALAASPTPGSAERAAAAKAKATISCANRAGTLVIPREKPRSRCVIYAHNQPIHAYEFDLRHIHWRHWGAKHATARAKSIYIGMGQHLSMPVKLLAARRVTKCGHRAYTRLRVSLADGTRSHLRPPACRRKLHF